MVKPFIKWAGGKSKQLPLLLKVLPEKCNTYYEPFLGGGALFWELASKEYFQRAVISDINSELIDSYQGLQADVGTVINHLQEYEKKHSECFYYNIRAIPANKLNSTAEVAGRFIYLNKTGFNGLYRVNKSGWFNVPWGKRKASCILDEKNLLACGKILKENNVSIHDLNFKDSASGSQKGDVVYFDPPYIKLNNTSFTSYTSNEFGEREQKVLAELFRCLHLKGVHVIASNSDTPLTRKLYEGFEFIEVQASRNISCTSEGRKKASELIIVGRGS